MAGAFTQSLFLTKSETPSVLRSSPSNREFQKEKRHRHSHSDSLLQRIYPIPPAPTPPQSRIFNTDIVRQRQRPRAHSLTNFPTTTTAADSDDVFAPPPPPPPARPTQRNAIMDSIDTPITPAKNNANSNYNNSTSSSSPRPQSSNHKLQDSPFSDYFTDDGRSPTRTTTTTTSTTALDDHEIEYASIAAISSSLSPEKQNLLMRLQKLQSHLIRGELDEWTERETMSILERKVGEMERGVEALHSQTRVMAEMEDSGLFMEDDEGEEEEENSRAQALATQLANSTSSPTPTPAQKQAESDYLLLESQRILHSISRAQSALKAQHADLRALNDIHVLQISALKSENDGLKMEREANRDEIGFLKLQFRGLEEEVRAVEDGAARRLGGSWAPGLREEIERVRGERLRVGLRRWSVDGERRRSGSGIGGVLRRSADGVLNGEVETVEDGAAAIAALEDVKQREREQERELEPEPDIANDHPTSSSLASESARVAEIEMQPTTSSPTDLLEKEDSELPQQPPLHPTITTDTTSTAISSMPIGSPVSQSLFDDHHADADVDDLEVLDCAITTSSEDNFVLSRSVSRKVVEEEQRGGGGGGGGGGEVKSAWQELLDGLASFAGFSTDE